MDRVLPNYFQCLAGSIVGLCSIVKTAKLLTDDVYRRIVPGGGRGVSGDQYKEENWSKRKKKEQIFKSNDKRL